MYIYLYLPYFIRPRMPLFPSHTIWSSFRPQTAVGIAGNTILKRVSRGLRCRELIPTGMENTTTN